METTPAPGNSSKQGHVFNKEEEEKMSTLEKLIRARKNLLNDIDRTDANDDTIDYDDEDTDGLKDYRGIF